MSPGKAPSEGQKVTAGQNAPYTSEAIGRVAPDSLASESQAFRQANEATPQQSENFSSGAGAAGAAGATGATHNADPAPTYVNNQYNRDPSGPHGKNLKGDNSIGNEKNTSVSEFGTKDDPGAAAEQKFTLADSTNAGSTGGRQKGIDGKTPYDALGSEANA
ncbi:hypothetical protein DL766_005079 [Monosporascus sp. MC13-8B]|uniref:SMP domain-containing protein n=1 Tax=Monosporascus cannonballus TaxID=155416 RepID=A0ABY0HHX3_9PEZI|nr:hypothetical protein DL762_000885 [Monosporascus cannonballus]RYO95645.1 hypothetical protein DL763_003616 [Monosporascus cannonballus]RYP30002.1 hypothetical protein DL766_005079 [Monosporascus sp. MC13-8B]